MTAKRKKAAGAGAAGVRAERQTTSGIPIKPFYGADDLPGDAARRAPAPGTPPFTRGIHPTMYRSRLWTMRQYAGFGTAKQTNERFCFLLAEGQTGLSVAFDLPTQMGYDSDHTLARGEVGRVGVAISCLADMEELLAGLPLERITTSMTINATAPLLLALYVAVADARGVARARLRGTVQNDVLKEYIARGTYIYPPAPSLRLITDVFDFTAREVPQWNSISVSGYHMREAGATAVQELAFTLADGLTYLEAARARGLDPTRIARRISFFFNAHNHLFEEVAKFRAARKLWADLSTREPIEEIRQLVFITAAFEQTLSRTPTPAEQAVCLEFLRTQTDLFQRADPKQLSAAPGDGLTPASPDPALRACESLVHSLFSHNDFVMVK